MKHVITDSEETIATCTVVSISRASTYTVGHVMLSVHDSKIFLLFFVTYIFVTKSLGIKNC